MENHRIVVVGDQFHQFANGKNAITQSQFLALSSLPDCCFRSNVRLTLGQGVRHDDVSKIIEANGLAQNVDCTDLQRIGQRAPGTHSHKRQTHNTVIAKPERIDEDLYVCALLIDERCELMGDHQTGQHIQGMILIEGFRQSFLAVSEEFYPLEGTNKTYFVINSMETSFSNFVFPLPAEVRVKVTECDAKPYRVRLRMEMTVEQCGVVCASCKALFTVYPESVIAEKEKQLATEAVLKVTQ